ncbi:hypothetical protein RyT2_29830 [Pseudolactococcus yaeyamensis]
MSAYDALNKIKELEHAISEFKQIKSDLQNYHIKTLNSAGSGQWSGQKKNEYKRELENAKNHLNQAKTQVGQAITECKSRQRSLYHTIDKIKHPDIAFEAWCLTF